jgi:gamma-glutamyl hydrolase
LYTFFCYGFGGLNDVQRDVQTNRPIIGITTQSTRLMPFKDLGKNYIPASYVKFLESSGARVVPIFNNLTEVETKKTFKSINGEVFP